MDTLAAFAKRSDASIDDAIAGIQKLKISSSKKGKENAGGGDSVPAIQECLKAAQKRLGQPGENTQQLALLCQSCLRLLEQQFSAKLSTKLHTLAYTTIRLLISAKAFTPALEEALRLHQSLCKELQTHKVDVSLESTKSAGLSSLSTDTLNLAVGAILTMALCFAEGVVKDSKQLSYVLSAADTAQTWFRLLPAQESAKHSQTLFKSLYRGSAKLLERKDWEGLQGACLTMLSGGGASGAGGATPPSTVPLALGATAKLASHVPEPYGVDLLNKCILNCPAIISSISILEEEKLKSSSSSGSGRASALEILSAALGAGNLLRKRLATLIMHGPIEAIIDTVGGEDTALEAAAALEIVASIIGVGNKNRNHSATPAAAVGSAPIQSFSEYAHSAAVSLACSARIRSACINRGIDIAADWEHSYNQAATRVLGWQWPDFSLFLKSRNSTTAAIPLLLVSTEELVWLSSSLYNVGIDLLTRGSMVEASIEPLRISLAASLTALSVTTAPLQNIKNKISKEDEDCDDSEDDSNAKILQQGVKDVGKRASVLIEALAKAGKEVDVLTTTAADVLAAVFCACPLMVSSFSAPYLTLVSSLVSTTVKQQLDLGKASDVTAPRKRQVGGRKTTKTKIAASATASANSTKSQSLTAAVQNHPTAQVSEDFLAMVARAELVAWAEAISNCGGVSQTTCSVGEKAEVAAAAAAQHLLDSVYPLDTAPLDHVRTLILVDKLNLNALVEEENNKKKNKESCIERAQRVLGPLVRKGDTQALILDSLVSAQRVLDDAQTLVEGSMEHQKVLQQEKSERIKLNPSEVHADDTCSSASSSLSTATGAAATAATCDFAEKQVAKWSSVVDTAHEVIEKLVIIAERFSKSSTLFKENEDGKALINSARELATLVGIHGLVEQEQQALDALAVLEQDENNTKDDSSSTSSVLQECILPTFDVSANGAALETAAFDLAVATTTNSRDPGVVMQRAELSMAASLAYAAKGAVVQALYCAGEGHRLLGSMVQTSEDGASGSAYQYSNTKSTSFSSKSSTYTECISWWNLSVSYCRSLLLVGRLFESAGMMDEGIVALKEGQRMAEAMGSSLLSAAFTSQLAQIYAISGQPAAASTSIQSAKRLLELPCSSSCCSNNSNIETLMVTQWIFASVACAETRVHAAAGEYTQAMLRCHSALDALEEIADEVHAGVKPHVDALVAAVHAAKLEVLKAEGREPEEIGTAAKEALACINAEACIAFGAAPRAGLLLTQAAAAEAAVEMLESEKLSSFSASAQLWIPSQTDKDDANLSNCTQYLWQALVCSRGAPHIHRFAAFKLAPVVASLGLLHLAALLVHIGAGSTLQLQHQLVLHARERNAQRRQRASASTLVGAGQKEAERAEAAAAHALNVLDADLDWKLIKKTLACDITKKDGSSASLSDKSANKFTVRRGGSSKRGNTSTQPASVSSSATSDAGAAAGEVHAALATLNTQAAYTLHKWLSLLPSGTPVCTVAARDDQNCLVISRLSLATTPRTAADKSGNNRNSSPEQEVIPIIMDIPIKLYGTCTSQHPIRALALDGADKKNNTGCSSQSAVASAVHEMERVFEDSTHSMKNMATDTRDQQREWWRTRVELDDALAALLQHIGEEWLGPWKCLLIGPPISDSLSSSSSSGKPIDNIGASSAESLRERVPVAVEQLLSSTGISIELLQDRVKGEEGFNSSLRDVLNELSITITHCMSAMSPSEQRQAAKTLCTALLQVSKEKRNEESFEEMVTRAVKLLINAASASSSSSGKAVVPPAAVNVPPATLKKAKKAVPPPTTRKVTFFQEETTNENEVSSSPSSSPEPRTQLRLAPSFNAIGIIDDGGSNLCSRFEALKVAGGGDPKANPAATPLPARTPGAATIRAKKHKSRLALMQGAVTPAAKSARKPLCPTTSFGAAGSAIGGGAGGGLSYSEDDSISTIPKKNIAGATAPRMPRALATPATAAYTMPARSRNTSLSSSSSSWSSASLNAGPVCAIFSPELQSLPWESAPGLVSQQIYRLHALPCAAAAAAAANISTTTNAGASRASSSKDNRSTAPPCVDISSAYYTINPSGDLQSTQDTFETWFKGLRGWSGRAGSPPSSSELAHALQSKELFVYCGHGGGEQYIPAAKLRGLPRCAASLLMGCSSGKLRGGGKPSSLSSFSSFSSSTAFLSGGKRRAGQHQQQQQQRQYYYYEPTGVVLAYLLAGCPAAVANLWDVTDRDIDRFAQAVLMNWLSSSSNSSSKNLKSGGDVAAAVALARGACKLPCLIGAAPVCYGVPTTVVSQ